MIAGCSGILRRHEFAPSFGANDMNTPVFRRVRLLQLRADKCQLLDLRRYETGMNLPCRNRDANGCRRACDAIYSTDGKTARKSLYGKMHVKDDQTGKGRYHSIIVCPLFDGKHDGMAEKQQNHGQRVFRDPAFSIFFEIQKKSCENKEKYEYRDRQ